MTMMMIMVVVDVVVLMKMTMHHCNDADDGVDDVYVAFNLIGFADAHPDLQLEQNLIETAFLQFSDLNQYISHSSGWNAKNEKSKHEKIFSISMAVKLWTIQEQFDQLKMALSQNTWMLCQSIDMKINLLFAEYRGGVDMLV